jgi:ketosteroid isomerase-like protein
VTACAIEPTFIHIEGKTAVAHVRATETVQDASGTKTTVGVSWTTTLIRDGKKWLVLGLGWADDQPKADEAAVRREVAESMKAWFAAWARCDLEAAMSGVADTPDVFYSDIDGTQTDRAGLRKMGMDAHVKVSAVIFSTLEERTNILAPDTVLYTWHGAVECAMKDGSTIRYDQMTMTILLRRTNGAWKVFHFHESALPAQQVKAPLTTTTTATPDRPAGTAQWSPSQLEALGVLQAACDAEKRNDFEGLSHLYHERFVAWDLAQASTLNRAAHLEAEADYLKKFKVIESTITPVAIQVADATAVVDVAYTMTTLAAGNGEKTISKGRWNATLVKEGSRWLFLSCAWSENK